MNMMKMNKAKLNAQEFSKQSEHVHKSMRNRSEGHWLICDSNRLHLAKTRAD